MNAGELHERKNESNARLDEEQMHTKAQGSEAKAQVLCSASFSLMRRPQ